MSITTTTSPTANTFCTRMNDRVYYHHHHRIIDRWHVWSESEIDTNENGELLFARRHGRFDHSNRIIESIESIFLQKVQLPRWLGAAEVQVHGKFFLTSLKILQQDSKYFNKSQNTSTRPKKLQQVSKYFNKTQNTSTSLKILQQDPKYFNKTQNTSTRLKMYFNKTQTHSWYYLCLLLYEK
jgi:hypothetical protein